ncbi:hypothetical protein [Pseudonocardia sp.]|uniref:hypothetical protein n=1 Tax=Pseudonocardia sp. TaxID=60912 RepID=UPI003D0FB9A9
MSVQSKPSTTKQAPLITSTVLAVVLRVAGPVTVGVLPHGLGHPERQVSVRIGDVVVHLTDKRVAARIRQRWDASVGQALRLREQVSQTWLRPRPGTYPAAVSVQLTDQVEIMSRFVPADLVGLQPAYLEVRVDQLVWQVCDLTAWRTIGDAWLAAQQYLER